MANGMGTGEWLVYGANGFTGELIAVEAKRRHMVPILAGRRENKVRPLAERLGFDHRVFSLDEPSEIEAGLAGVDAVVLAAGPFSATSRPMVDACLATHTHYLDITGEIAVFEAIHARDAEAAAAGVTLMPGVGFDVVPTDCLAASLHRALPSATELELAISGGGSWSRGTAKTMIEGMSEGGAVRVDGRIEPVPTMHRTREVPFRDKPRTCVSIPWGDVSTAYYSTGIPNITVYMYLPPNMRRAMKTMSPLLPMLGWKPLQNLIKTGIEHSVTGPDARTRERVRSQLWGRVADPDGNAVEGTLVTPEGYRLTAEATVAAVRRVLAGGVRPGALTPSMAFGPDFVGELDGCDLRIGADD